MGWTSLLVPFFGSRILHKYLGKDPYDCAPISDSGCEQEGANHVLIVIFLKGGQTSWIMKKNYAHDHANSLMMRMTAFSLCFSFYFSFSFCTVRAAKHASSVPLPCVNFSSHVKMAGAVHPFNSWAFSPIGLQTNTILTSVETLHMKSEKLEEVLKFALWLQLSFRLVRLD